MRDVIKPIPTLKQVYKRFVEIGRVALINEGPDQGKLCVIIDVVDQRRVRHLVVYLEVDD